MLSKNPRWWHGLANWFVLNQHIDDGYFGDHLLYNLVWFRYVTDDFASDLSWHTVRFLHVHDLFHWNMDVLDLLHGDLPGHRHLHHLLHYLLNGVRDITVADDFMRNFDFVGLRDLNLVVLRIGLLHGTHYLAGYCMGNRSIHHFFNGVGDTYFFWDGDAMRYGHLALNHLGYRIGLWHLDDFFHCVGFRYVDDLLDWVRCRHVLRHFDFHRAIDLAGDNLLHWVRDGAFHNLLHGVLDRLLDDALHRVGSWSVDNLLNRMRNRDMLQHTLVNGHRHLYQLFHNFLDGVWYVHRLHHFLRNRNNDVLDNLVGNRNLDTTRDRNFTSDLHHFLERAVNRNFNNSFHDYVLRNGNNLFNEFFHGPLHGDFFNLIDLVVAMHRTVDNLLHWVGLLNDVEFRNLLRDGNLDNSVHWIRNFALVAVRHRDVVRLRSIDITYLGNPLGAVHVPHTSAGCACI